MTSREHPGIQGYRDFLKARDGDADVYADTLSRREAFFRRIEAEPVRSRRVFDRDTFLRNLRRTKPEPGLDDGMLWLLATAKSNQGERFGVELGRLYGRGPQEGDAADEVHLMLQESYHTRILADAVAVFGLPVPSQPPRWMARTFIKTMVFNPFPKPLILPVVGMAEMLGCVVFRLLRDRAVEIFGDEPRVVERVALLFDEILADEICHVGLVEARLGRFGRRVMRGLYNRFAASIVTKMGPEYVAVMGRERILEALDRPFDQKAQAAEFPTTAYAF